MNAMWQEKCDEVMEFKAGIYAGAADPRDHQSQTLGGDEVGT